MTQEFLPIVEFAGVVKRYGDGPMILDNVSFKAERGDFISLIGPSGCGKSTVLKLISGLNPISGGKIVVDGMSPKGAVEKLSFVFQEPTLLPWHTVEKNVELPMKLHGTPSAGRAEVAARCLSLVGLSDRRDYYPRQLSGGQKMRVSIARALSVSPKILLLDEPFGALDEMIRHRLNLELQRIWSENPMTTLLVTHSIAEAVFLADRVVVMRTNPGGFGQIVPIELPRPRRPEDLRSPAFHSYCDRLSELLFEGGKD
jgi:NitT/TauT family transport system ATP-binding protein